MKKIIVFGVNDFAQLADTYLMLDSRVELEGFCVDRKYLKEPIFCGKPVIPFDEIERKFPPYSHQLFAPLADNKLRERIYNEGRKRGYRFYSYISPKATNYSRDIGQNCFILEDNTIQPFTKIGNNVVLWSGNHIGHHSVIQDCVTLTSHVVISGHCTIKKYAYLGVNSTVRDYVTIEEGCVIGMSAAVVKSTEANKTYTGIPAKCS